MLKMYLIKWNEVSYDNMYINYYVDISLRWNVTLRKSLDQFWWAWRLTPWMMPLNWSMLIPMATAPPSSRPMAPLLGNTLWRSMWDRLVYPSLSISMFWGHLSLSTSLSLNTCVSKFWVYSSWTIICLVNSCFIWHLVIVFTGRCQCPYPRAFTNVFLHWIQGVLPRGHELLWKSCKLLSYKPHIITPL